MAEADNIPITVDSQEKTEEFVPVITENQERSTTETANKGEQNLETLEGQDEKSSTTGPRQSIVLKVPKTVAKKKDKGIYMRSLITKKVCLPINMIGSNIKENLEKSIAKQIEGKCIAEGYIRQNSTEIVTFSSGLLKDSYVNFEIVIQCMICCPVEGMLIDCEIKNITKAGLRAETKEEISPVVIFIARDHHYSSELFNNVNEGDDIKIRVIGQRFELNDKKISIIGELVDRSRMKSVKKFSKMSKLQKPKLIIKDRL